MGFSDKQAHALGRCVPARHVRSRVREGKEISYIEGWYVLAQANRIFGFDAWDRETIETKCILARETRGTFTSIYAARVRITVRTAGGVVVRDGHGTGEAQGVAVGEAHDRALKAAETDATKRALATFGKAFGLDLYAGKGRSAAKNRTGASRSANHRPQVSEEPESRDSVNESELTTTSSDAPDGHPPLRTGTRSTAPQIDKSALAFAEPRRVRDKEHLRYVASQPCLVCGTTPCDAHHIRFAQPRALGRKVGDEFTVPLCRPHHRELHRSGNEAAWWHEMGIDPLNAARRLWIAVKEHPKGDESSIQVAKSIALASSRTSRRRGDVRDT